MNQEIINCTFLRCPSTRRPRMPRLRSRQEVKRSERLGFVVVPSARASSAAISEREDQAAPPLSRFVLASRRVITFVHRMRGAISKHPNLISVPAEGWNHPPSHGSKSPVELSSFPWLSARLLLHPSSKRCDGEHRSSCVVIWAVTLPSPDTHPLCPILCPPEPAPPSLDRHSRWQ